VSAHWLCCAAGEWTRVQLYNSVNMLKKKKKQILNYTLSVSELNCCWMQIRVSDAPWGQANQNCSSLEKRKVYLRAKPGEWVAHAQKVQTPWWFSRKSFIGKIFREGYRACEFFWLVGPEVTEWDFRNPNHQPSVGLRSQHVVTILHQVRVGASVPVEELGDVLYVAWGGTRTLLCCSVT